MDGVFMLVYSQELDLKAVYMTTGVPPASHKFVQVWYHFCTTFSVIKSNKASDAGSKDIPSILKLN